MRMLHVLLAVEGRATSTLRSVSAHVGECMALWRYFSKESSLPDPSGLLARSIYPQEFNSSCQF